MKVRWSQFGKVTKPGEYNLQGYGKTYVDQKIIDAVQQVGGDPWIVLSDIGLAASREYVITGVDPT